MFIRRVTTTNGVTKKRYSYLNLVESVRTEKGPRQRLILNLGELDIDRSQYRALARRIEDILTGRKSLFEIDQELEHHARRAADKIFAKRAQELNAESSDELEMATPFDEFLADRNDHFGHSVSCHGVASSDQAVAGAAPWGASSPRGYTVPKRSCPNRGRYGPRTRHMGLR